MVVGDNSELIALPQPELISSSGHNRAENLVAQVMLQLGAEVEYLTLNSGAGLLWGAIEIGKEAYKSNYPYGSDLVDEMEFASGGINMTVERVRSSRFFNSLLLSDYTNNLHSNGFSEVLSSHYMAFHELKPGQKGIYFIPDHALHEDAVAHLVTKPDVKFVCPFINNSERLRALGVSKDRIFEGFPAIGLMSGSKSEQNIESEVRRQRLLLTIGSNGLEIDYLLERIPALKALGYDLTVLCGPGMVNEKTIQSHKRFRTACRQLLDLEGGDEIYGGFYGWTRENDINKLYELMFSGEFFGIVSRPNEIPFLANIFNIPQILLPHFQHHERIAQSALIGANAAINIEDLIANPEKLMTLNGREEIFHPLRSIREFEEFLKAA
jgi:hypothetical protein